MSGKRIMGKLLALVACAALVLGVLSGCAGDDSSDQVPASQENQTTIDNAMSIQVVMDYDDAVLMGYEGTIEQGEVLLPPNGTALDTLVALGCDIEENDGFVESIDGLGLNDIEQGSGWTYQVNNEYPEFSADECVLQSGDVVTWSFYIPSAN